MARSTDPLRDVRFLTVDDVVQIHSLMIDAITPDEPKGILDRGRLEAAVMAPQQTFDGQYLYPSVVEMAAAYHIGLATGHAFQQGNKRIGFLACYTFLAINGFELTVENDAAVRLTLETIDHTLDRSQVVDILRRGCQQTVTPY